MLQGCYILIQSVEMLLSIWMIYSLYPECRRGGRWIKCVWTAGCVILGILYVGGMWNSFISNIFILIFSLQFTGIYFIFYKVKLVKVFLLEVLFLTSISFLKMPVLILEGILYGKTLIELNRGECTMLECIWCIMLTAGILLVMRKRRVFERYKELGHLLLTEHIGMLTAVTGMQWILLSCNMWLGKRGFQAADLVLNVLLLFCMSLFLYYLLMRTAFGRMKLDKNNLDISQSLLQEQNEKLHEIYQKSSLRLHEYYRTMSYLYFCITEGKFEEAENFLKDHLEDLDEEKREIWTGLPFLDFILNYKKQAIDKRNITFRLELDVYEYPFEEAELGVLLGNLLDNAIEACGKCAPGKREIYLRIWNVRYMFMLRLVNSSSQSPKMNGEKFLTDKADKNAHGMGVEQARRIVKKYRGDIDFQYDKGYFVTQLIAPIKKEEEE